MRIRASRAANSGVSSRVNLVAAITRPLGVYLHRVFEGERQPLPRSLGRLERSLLWLSGVERDDEQTWKQYALSLITFSLVGALFTYAILRLQHLLPLNPQGMGPVPGHLAFNTAVSFATNTNWQGYAGETTMSYLTQMLGLTVQNFVSAATGMAVLVALVVMSLLALMAWQGVDGMLRARDASQQRLEATLRLNTALAQWQQDLLSIQQTPAVLGLRFDGASGNIPYLTLTARADANDITAIASVTGPATTPTLVLSNVLKSDEGGYSVVVTNSEDSVTSAVATLTVLPSVSGWEMAKPTGERMSAPVPFSKAVIFSGASSRARMFCVWAESVNSPDLVRSQRLFWRVER